MAWHVYARGGRDPGKARKSRWRWRDPPGGAVSPGPRQHYAPVASTSEAKLMSSRLHLILRVLRPPSQAEYNNRLRGQRWPLGTLLPPASVPSVPSVRREVLNHSFDVDNMTSQAPT